MVYHYLILLVRIQRLPSLRLSVNCLESKHHKYNSCCMQAGSEVRRFA